MMARSRRRDEISSCCAWRSVIGRGTTADVREVGGSRGEVFREEAVGGRGSKRSDRDDVETARWPEEGRAESRREWSKAVFISLIS